MIYLCLKNNIPVKLSSKKVRNGWNGASKGMLQILYERGFIDTELIKSKRSSRYSIAGKKGGIDWLTGEIKEECKQYSLTHVLSKCIDFKMEKTDIEKLLEEIGSKLGSKSSILYTPKFNCELVGKGIEYI